ncbi:hypothetical protein CU044_1038 [Streptomyces sp. L-9-10]|nr:hypothetical protein CU044_1038 [Streptomyces sp. L-9-10]
MQEFDQVIRVGFCRSYQGGQELGSAGLFACGGCCADEEVESVVDFFRPGDRGRATRLVAQQVHGSSLVTVDI